MQYTIEKKRTAKEKAQRDRSIAVMKKYGDKYKCSECLHGKLKCCTDNLPNGCEYWYNPLAKQPYGIKLRN